MNHLFYFFDKSNTFRDFQTGSQDRLLINIEYTCTIFAHNHFIFIFLIKYSLIFGMYSCKISNRSYTLKFTL